MTYFIIMRKITGLIIEIDPIAIVEKKIGEMNNKILEIQKHMGSLNGLIINNKRKLEDKKSDFENQLRRLEEYKRQGKVADANVTERQVVRLKATIERQAKRLEDSKKWYEILKQLKHAAELTVLDTQNEVNDRKEEFESIKAQHKAFSSIMSIMKGSPDEMEDFTRAMDFMAYDITQKLGEMSNVIDETGGLLSQIAVDEGVASHKADAIVVNKNIRTVGDLIGKVVACSEGTASHTLLLNTLETNGIGSDKVNTKSSIDKSKVNIKIVGSGLDAASIFKAGQCDAAVVFSPDDQDIVASIAGSKVLVSTKQASNIICDGLIAKQSYLDANKEDVKKLISALLSANVKMNTDDVAVAQAAKAFAKSYGTDEAFAISGSKNIRYITLEDAANFFGLNSSYTGIKGDELYSKMARTYESLNLCKRPLAWRKVSDASVIEELMADPSAIKGDQHAEAKKTFTAPTKELETKAEMSNKKLTIEYPVNGDLLDNDAKALIDREFVSIAKQFSGARVRIEGNTDNTGNAAYNVELSKRRAQSVANYLIKEYGFDTNRFIIVGNGPKKAVEDGVSGSNQSYRTTDFQLVNE